MSGTVRKLVAAGALALSVPVSTGLFAPAQAAEPATTAMSSSVRPEVEAPFPRAASAETTAPWGLLGLFGLLGLLGLARRAPESRPRRQENVAGDDSDPFAQYRTAHETSPEDNPALYPNAAAAEYEPRGQHAAPGRHQQQARHAGQYPPQQTAQQTPQQAPQPAGQQVPPPSSQPAAQPASQRWPQRETGWYERESAPAEAERQEQRPAPPQPPNQPPPQASRPAQQQRPPVVQPGPDASWQRPEPHPTDSATWHADRPQGEDPRPDWFGQRREPTEQLREDHPEAPSHSTSAAHDDWSHEDPEPPDDAGSEEGRRHRF